MTGPGVDEPFFTADYAAPSAGMYAVPVMLLWAASFGLTIIWIIVKLISRLRRSRK